MKSTHIIKTLMLAGFLFSALSISAQYKLPAYQKFKLKNGLTVYLMEQHEVPVINVSAIFPAGAIYDGKQSGLASLTATALMHGTTDMPKKALDEMIDFMAAGINTSASKESAGLSAKFAAKDSEKAMQIISRIIMQPAFDTAEFNKEKKRILIGLEQRKESPRTMSNSFYEKLIFGAHPYGNVVSGTVQTVEPLTTMHIRNFYNNHYYPEGSAIAIVGNFKSADMKKMVTRMLGSWKSTGKKPANPANVSFAPVNGNNVLLVNKDDARETTFYIGGTGISRNNPDQVAIEVVNTYFGGRFTSLLNDELRVNSGLTYGARSSFQSYKNGGTFYISTFTANKTTEPAIQKTLDLIQRLHEKGMDEQALASAKNYVKGQFPPRYETAGQLAQLLTSMFWYQYDESYINQFEKNVDGLTVEKARQIIARYFPKDKLQFVLIGKASEIKEFAAKLGKVTETEIKKDIQ
ncbi:MAG TPA: pitrilysin family protein [Ferruginibacter sp.]|nr:pitrilysin family protein [Ferruginibacter sp.]HRO06826.1 pitrilysin family protein [Ferruginibacter sp.]HRO96388.1 pitrilysin family protein [Ferruginibacter sp.]HRP48493.1 pitrilysin family protein [Ferruginibacter sp.]